MVKPISFWNEKHKLLLLNNASKRGAILLLQSDCGAIRKKRYGIHPLNKQRKIFGEFHTLYHSLRRHEDRFFSYCRLNLAQFDYLLEILLPYLTKASIREPVSPTERLFVTLRYLGSGIELKNISESFRLGATTVAEIVVETATAICEQLKNYLRFPRTKESWKKIADVYWNQTKMPHCVGALDGKHCQIKKPPNSGSLYYNYKKQFSVVLLAICGAKMCFNFVDIGTPGSVADGNVFRTSALGKCVFSYFRT